MLTVENLRFSYVPGQDIMKDVTFTIGSGEFITLGGRNGCGKTTVTRLLAFYWLCIPTTRSSNVPPNCGRRGGIWAGTVGI